MATLTCALETAGDFAYQCTHAQEEIEIDLPFLHLALEIWREHPQAPPALVAALEEFLTEQLRHEQVLHQIGQRLAQAAQQAALQAQQAASQARYEAARKAFVEKARELDAYRELADASNAVIDMVRAGRLDEAEAAARDLLVRYPDVHDGHDRLEMGL